MQLGGRGGGGGGFAPGVADADDGVHIGERELEHLVQRNGRRVRKAHQRVVCEHHLVQAKSMQVSVVCMQAFGKSQP